MLVISTESGHVEVDEELYGFFSTFIDGELSESEMPDGISLYDFFEDYLVSGHALIDLPKLTKNVLDDWGDLYDWFEAISTSPSLNKLVSFVDPAIDDFSYEDYPPIKFFKSEEMLVKSTIEFLLQDEEFMSAHGICYSVVMCSGRKLYLLFTDINCWALGHCQSVRVISSWDSIPNLY